GEDVAGGSEVDVSAGLLGAHEGGGASSAAGGIAAAGAGDGHEGVFAAGAGVGIAADGEGEAPIDDERFAEPTEHDVLRLEVSVENAAVVGVGQRLAGGDEAAEEVAELDRL